MNDIAISFEKYDLGDERFVFKPISIIRGTYDAQNNQFETDYGVICDSIEGENYESDCFFHCLTSINELKKCFGSNNSEEALLAEYYDLCRDYCYIGYFNGDEIVVNSIPFDEIEDFSDLETTSIGLFEDDEETKILFNLNGIKELRNSNDIVEIHSKLDSIIGFYNQIMGGVQLVLKKKIRI